jgi:hypothetical protein
LIFATKKRKKPLTHGLISAGIIAKVPINMQSFKADAAECAAGTKSHITISSKPAVAKIFARSVGITLGIFLSQLAVANQTVSGAQRRSHIQAKAAHPEHIVLPT